MTKVNEFFSNIFERLNNISSKYLTDLLEKIYNFAKNNYTVFAIITVVVAIIFIVGFFAMLIKCRKLLFFILFIAGLVVLIGIIFGKSNSEYLSAIDVNIIRL